VIHTYISFPAGLAKMQPVWFAGLSLLGSTVWVTFLAVLGYEVGANYTRVSGPIGTAAIAIAVVVVIGLVVWYLRGRSQDAPTPSSGG